ncbi:MAG: HEAT repeat domain-containing protein [Microcystaceae cyanobacterium]
MNYYPPSLLLIVQLIGWSFLSVGIQPIKPVTAIENQYIAQSPSPTPINPLELINPYDNHMQEGYRATRERDYEKALSSFKKALEERPEDPYAKQAIQNIQSYMVQNPPVQSNPDWLKWIIGSLAVGGVGALSLAFILLRQPSKNSTFEKKGNPSVSNQYQSAEEPLFSAEEPLFTVENPSDERDIWDTSLPIQATTRLPNPELMDELIQELQNTQPKKRRRAIWKLAQNADSRAMKPLVELMIDADSYERNLILEALSQISTRTIKPMNQALALSLQDKNPQVRKNAIRDLTRLYDMMSQVSQLLCHAIDDTDEEVQETAKWALTQLNLQMPPRLDLLINKDNETINPDLMNNHIYEEPSEVDQ